MSEGTIDLPAGIGNERAYERAAMGAGAAPANQALAERLRAQHRRIVERRTAEFPIPGWDGQLVAKVRIIADRDEYAATAHADDSDSVFIATATIGLRMRDEEGTLVDLEDEAGPIRFDQRLAEMLGLDVTSGTGVVNVMLDNPLRVSTFALRILEWMQGDESSAIEQTTRPT